MGWAWGLIQIRDEPAVRYGVSSPGSPPVGDVVILPGYGESAEWWFETARDLNKVGYTVWVLDGVGQGGSGRATAVRDLGHATDPSADAAALSALTQVVIRPDQPIRILASGAAGASALAAAENGLAVERLVLSAPAELPFTADGAPYIAARLGLRTVRAKGADPWKRPGQFRTAREKSALGWAVANPDLRMGGPSAGWLMARDALVRSTMAPASLAKVRSPVTIVTPANDASVCSQLPSCEHVKLPAALPYHLENDGPRDAWLAAITRALGTNHAL